MKNENPHTTIDSHQSHIGIAIDCQWEATGEHPNWIALSHTDQERAEDGKPDATVWAAGEGWVSTRFTDLARAEIGCRMVEFITGKDFVLVINEEGKLDGSMPNTLATQVAREAGIASWDMIVGRAIFMPIRTWQAIDAAYEAADNDND